MKKLNLIILSLLISTSANAQQPALPELGLPDLTLEENTENKAAEVPAVTVSNEEAPKIPPLPNALAPVEPSKEQDKVLNKAIEEVFKEPSAPSSEPALAPPTAAENKPAEVPAVLNDPSVRVIEVSSDTPLIESETNPSNPTVDEVANDNPEVPAVIQPEETQAAEALEENEVVVEEEPKKEIITEKKEPIKKRVQPRKNVVFPTQTPKSLRQNYTNPIGSSDFNSFAPSYERNIINQNIKEEIKYEGLPENTRPIMLNNNWKNNKKQNFAKLIESEEVDKVLDRNADKPKSLRYTSITPENNEEKIYSRNSNFLETKKKSNSDLDILTFLPERKEKLEIKSDIKIDEAKFENPFPEETLESENNSLLLAESDLNQPENNQNAQDGTPVVDFSDNQIENIENLASGDSGNISPDFYDRDLGLKVEVKERVNNSIAPMKSAFEALQVGQYESAIEYYKEALARNPNNFKARFGLATSYHKSKQFDNAKEEYLKIINSNPKFWPAVNNYVILVSEENPESSLEKLEKLRNNNPSFAAISAQLGNIYFEKGNLGKAIKNYIEALKVEPENVDYKYNLAVILEKSGNFRDAAEVYRSLLEDSAKGIRIPENPLAIRDRYDLLTSKSRS